MIKIIIGITGPNAAGKGEVVKYLVKKNFYAGSLSDILRKKAKDYNILPTRDNLIKLGNTLRKKYGSGILAKWFIKDLVKLNKEKVVVDSIRNVEEIKEFKKKFKNKFYLIYVTASLKRRFRFMLKRRREGDPVSYKEFLKIEKMENSKISYHQQINKCKKLRDFLINNNSTLKNLHKKIDIILKKICPK
ncbi:MAG: AAA family ATPase [Elusimicrobiota bacterium]|nr:AAA family ATPase [Endomicrobiia bacterium]MDW8165259.1 AAA family ATPase [Elusimicrobiota bacterium]